MLKRLLCALALLAPLTLMAQTGTPATPAPAQPKPTTPAAKPAEIAAPADAAKPANPSVVLHTTMGDITLELFADKAPKSVENFLQYAKDGFYNGTIFHRVIDGFMVQGGGFTPDLTQKHTRAPIANEANNGLSNLKGTVAMARTTDPHSATAQFFVNVVDNKRLDFVSDQNGMTYGYAVFGKVTSGQDVIDKIKAVETEAKAPLPKDVPKTPIVIEKVDIVK
jgi:peptidyl-prolyl cis-trans isomerase A (cyclophilin A)